MKHNHLELWELCLRLCWALAHISVGWRWALCPSSSAGNQHGAMELRGNWHGFVMGCPSQPFPVLPSADLAWEGGQWAKGRLMDEKCGSAPTEPRLWCQVIGVRWVRERREGCRVIRQQEHSVGKEINEVQIKILKQRGESMCVL